MEKCNSWIQTFTKQEFDPLNPDIKKIDIIDIGHALSNLCRYGGHCPKFYSVAQHSVIVADFIFTQTRCKEKAMAGLLHDASEAYMVDIPRPIKQFLPDYIAYEDILLNVIFEKFNVTFHKDLIKYADERVLMTETRDMMGDPKNWNIKAEPIKSISITPISSTSAKSLFYHTFNKYLTEKNSHEPITI